MSLVIDLTNVLLNDTFPDIPLDEIKRDYIIDTVDRYLLTCDVLFIEGDSGVGKTTFLAQFVKSHPFSAVSYFIIPSIKFSYTLVSLKRNLFAQLYFYLYAEVPDELEINDDNFLNACYSDLLKKIRKNGNSKPLYFVFDSFTDISNYDLVLLNELLTHLPWGKAKFIFSGGYSDLKAIMPAAISHKPLPLNYFSYNETKEYFKDLTTDEGQLKEIYNVCSKGMPEKLSQVKRICQEMGSVDKFLSEDITEKTNLFELEWNQNPLNSLQRSILALLAFDETRYSSEKIANILDVPLEGIKETVKTLCFIDVSEDKIVYKSENHKRFAQQQLQSKRQEIFDLLIKYYETNPSTDESLFNLPSIYLKAKRWQDMLKFLSLNAFVSLIEKTQSLATVKRQFDYGFDAAKQFSRFNGDYLRFALYKSSIQGLEKYDNWEDEIGARIALNQYDKALQLANSAFLKEDRLRLLAVLVKEQRVKKTTPDKIVLDQIRDLYEQIDFELIKRNAIDLASVLLYSHPELAIDLVEKAEKNSSEKNSVDLAFTYLSIFAEEANRKTNSTIANIDIIKAKIKDNELQNLAGGYSFFSNEVSEDEIIANVSKLSSTSRKTNLLRKWIANNKSKANVEKVIEYALDTLLINAEAQAPNAAILADLAAPLPLITNKIVLENLINLFDSQKDAIMTPTKDYVTLQLTIAEALLSIDKQKAKDRLFEIYLIIEEVQDLSIKTDCLCLLWVKLLEVDVDQSIAKEITSSSSIEIQIDSNLDSLLLSTAYHVQMVESILKTVTPFKPQFSLNLIEKVNTAERRDHCYQIAIKAYVDQKEVDEIDFGILQEFYSRIGTINTKEVVLINIVTRFYRSKEKIAPLLPKILRYLNLIFEITNHQAKCFLIIRSIKILEAERTKYKSFIDKLITALEKTWDVIDVLWEKVSIGFSISRDIADFSEVLGMQYLENTSKIKEDYNFTSSSAAAAYLQSIQLTIKSLTGLMTKVKDLSNNIQSVAELINQIPSNGEKLRLWNDLALRLIAHNRMDDFNRVVKDHIKSGYYALNKEDKYYHYEITRDLAPTFFYSDASNVFWEKLKALPREFMNSAIDTTINFILSKQTDEDYSNKEDVAHKLTYDEYVNLCMILGHCDDDVEIYDTIREITFSINYFRLPIEQKNDIKRRLLELINTKLPNFKFGIKHDGYKVIAMAHVLTLDVYNKKEWDTLLDEARAITNLSDRAFVLMLIAKIMNTPSKKYRIDLLEEATDLIKQIPSNFDKANRYDIVWEISFNVAGRGLFEKIAKESVTSLVSDKDGNLNNLNNLIDLAQQYNSNLAEHIVTVVDNDQVRRKLKEPLEKRILTNKKIRSVQENFGLIKNLSQNETQKLIQDSLVQLNSGRYTSKEINETLSILDKISKLPLDEAYDLISYFIQNAVKKYEHSEKQIETLDMIFKATYDNSRLIEMLSLDSLIKMKNRFKYLNSKQSSESPIIRFGDRGVAIDYIREWLQTNVKKSLTIIDPYFSEEDLDIIQVIQDVDCKIEIKVLTSKENGNNCHENNEGEYNLCWQKISSESPPETLVTIVWINSSDERNKKSPFHDRWWVADDCKSGLKIGTSYNSLGLSKDSQLSVMSTDDLNNVDHTIINDYLVRRERRYGDYKLNYSSFELFSN